MQTQKSCHVFKIDFCYFQKMITSPVALITHGAIAIAAAAGAWTWQANAYTARLATLQTQYAQAQHRAVETAHAETIRLQHIKDAAQQAAAVRAARMATDRDRLRLAADGLRNDLATAERRLRTASDDARAGHAAAVRAVLSEFAETAVKLAGQADGHVSDIRLMLEASGQKITDER